MAEAVAVTAFSAPVESTVPAAARPRPRLFGCLRLLLALMVALHHARWIGGEFWRAVWEWHLAGPAVYVFFVLSGWVVAEANRTFYAGRPWHFVLNRVLRIDPPYHAALLISMAAHWVIAQDPNINPAARVPPDSFTFSNFAGNAVVIWLWHGLSALGIAPTHYFVQYCWTLAVETKFYVYMTGVYLLARHLSGRGGRWHAYTLQAGVLLLLLGHLGFWVLGLRWLVDFEYMAPFVVGMCGYHALETRDRFHVVAALAALVVSLRYTTAETSFELWLYGLLVLAMIPLSAVHPRGWLARVDQGLGDLTYFLYLNHYVVLIVFMAYWGDVDLTAWVYVPTAFVVSWASRYLTEPWTQKLRERIRGARLG